MSDQKQALPTRLPKAVQLVLLISAADHGVTAGQVLSGSHIAAVCKARRQAVQTLRRMGFSQTQVGGFLNLHHTSVSFAEHSLRVKPKAEEGEVPVPDLSGEWAI